MFDWWIRWRLKKSREIFWFFDGFKTRAVDPWKCRRLLFEHQTFNWESHPVLIDSGDAEAREITLSAIREVFGVRELNENGDGLGEDETLGVLLQFVNYMADLKKNTSQSLISPPATAPERLEGLTTKPSLACTSTWNEPTPAAPAHS